MRWTWEVRCQDLLTHGTIWADAIPDVIEQVRVAVSTEWGNEPIYTGQPLRVEIRIEHP